MLLSLCGFAQPVKVSATDNPEAYYSYMEMSEYGAVCITMYNDVGISNVVVPDTLGGLPVMGIENSAFSRCDYVESITIPEGITYIASWAFMECMRLTDVSIPGTVATVQSNTFYNCPSLTSITLGDGVSEIGPSAFSECTSLTSVTIPVTMGTIQGFAFDMCYSLTDIYYAGTQQQWEEIYIDWSGNEYLQNAIIHFNSTGAEPLPDGILGMGSCGTDMTWSLDDAGTLTFTGSGAMNDFSADRTPWWSLRASIQRIAFSGNITSIGNYAFSCCNKLTEVSIPDSITHIGENAFVSCTGLTDINIGDGVVSIGSYAFSSCTALTKIEIPKNVTIIGDDAFYFCIRLSEITVVAENKNYASDCGILYNKEMTTLLCAPEGFTGRYTVPEGVTAIADNAFSNCEKLTGITIAGSVTTLGDNVFNRCYALTDVTLSNGVETMGSSVFYNCTALTQIVFPDSITTMGSAVFQGCNNLAFAALGSGVTSLGYYVFDGCTNLKSVYIPAGITNISRYVFDDCDSLTDVYYGGTQEQWESVTVGTYNDDLLNAQVHYNTMDITADSGTCGENLVWTLDLAGTLTITGTGPMTNYVYNSTLSTKSTHPWDDTANAIRKIVIEDGVTSIGANAFTYFPNLTTVEIPNSVTAIGNYAFWHCASLTDVVIPSGVTTLGDFAFRDCSSLAHIDIPVGILSINSGLFAGCTSLTEITIPDNVVMINRSAFESCSGLTEITLPNRLTSIALNAFYNCVKLENVHYIGTQAQWQAISIDTSNNYLTGANIHYNINAIVARIGGLNYSSFATALASAQPGDTVQLLADVQAEDVLLTNGVILDLNGHTLTVDALTAYAEDLADGYVKDSRVGNGGLLIVEKEEAVFRADNEDLPLYDAAAGGYRFFDYKMELFGSTTNAGTGREKFWFKFHFYTDDTAAVLDADAYDIVAAGGSGMEVGTRLRWKDNELPQVRFVKDGSADAFVQAWAKGATAARWFYITVNGLDRCGNGTLQLTPEIFINGVKAANGSVVYKVEDDYGWSEGIQ